MRIESFPAEALTTNVEGSASNSKCEARISKQAPNFKKAGEIPKRHFRFVIYSLGNSNLVRHRSKMACPLRRHLSESCQKSFHLGLFSYGEPHVVRQSREESADLHIPFLQGLNHRHDRTFQIEHDEVGL